MHFLLKLGNESSNTENKITPQVVVTSGVMRLGERSCKIKNGRYRIRTVLPKSISANGLVKHRNAVSAIRVQDLEYPALLSSFLECWQMMTADQRQKALLALLSGKGTVNPDS